MYSRVNILRVSILLLLLLSPIGGAANAADARPGMAAFGDKLSFQSMSPDAVTYGATGAGEGFTILFSGIEAATADGAPVVSKVASLVVPVTGPAIDATFVVGAFASTSDGGEVTLVLVVNDRTAVMHFPPNSSNKDVQLQLRYRAKGVSDLRITILALVDVDHDHPGSGALLTVSTLDGNMGSANAHPRKK
jgi:hypothetical protein